MKQFIDPKAKIFFTLPPEDGMECEALWAQELGGNRYKLANCPFFLYGVSLHDIVLAPPDRKGGRPTFERVLWKSGNRTIRVVFDEPVETGNSSDGILQGLVSLGCGYEGATRNYITVNIPSRVPLEVMRDYLDRHDVMWEHADPTCEVIAAAPGKYN